MTPTESIKTLIDQSKEYLETKIELTKLKAIDKSAEFFSGLIAMISVFIMSFLVIVFVSVAVALLVGKLLGEYYYGFFAVGGFYALILLILFVQRKRWIKTPVANGLISKMLK